MTKERIKTIIKEHGGYESQAWVLEAMKSAVNEALEEAAETSSQPQYILNLMVE